jgi:hypothetical protein
MDGQRFDRFARAVSSSTSRRQVLGTLAMLAVAGMRPGRARAAQDPTPPPTCAGGLTYCEGAGCVDLQADLDHCGACGSVCESGLVPVECREGECVRANCPPGIEFCGAVDLCRNLSVDPEHCGACGNACESGLCDDGVCSPSGGDPCEPGQVNCGGECVDTCCNNAHCGACGIACPAGTTCFEGICDCPSGLCCEEGEVQCGETCVATCCDNTNCGACGNVCTGGLTCFEGQCDCPSGDCGPVEPPDTGVGDGGSSIWLAAAGASALAASLAVWQRKDRDVHM